MPINTTAIQQAIDELEQRRADDLVAIEALKRIISPRTPRASKNGGGKARAPGKRGRPRVKKAMPNETADAIHNHGVRVSPYPVKRTCGNCDNQYTATGPRSKCPACA